MTAKSKANPPRVRHNVNAQLIRRTGFRPLRGSWERPAAGPCRDPAKLPLIIRDATWVKFADRFFHLRQEGLYQFWDFGKLRYRRDDEKPEWVDTRQRYTCVILYRRDILALLSGLACIQLHGPRFDFKPHAERLARAKQGILSLTCGPTTEFVRTILDGLGWRTRPISLVRIREPYTLWDDGHILFEFYWPKYRKWVLADVDNHLFFMKGGRYLHAGEVTELIRRRATYDLVHMGPPGISTLDLSDGVMGDMPAALVAEAVRSDLTELRRRLDRLFAMPLIAADGYLQFYHSSAAVRSRIRKTRRDQGDIKSIPREEWWHRFYGRSPPA